MYHCRYVDSGAESALRECVARIQELEQRAEERERERKGLEDRSKALQKQLANAKVWSGSSGSGIVLLFVCASGSVVIMPEGMVVVLWEGVIVPEGMVVMLWKGVIVPEGMVVVLWEGVIVPEGMVVVLWEGVIVPEGMVMVCVFGCRCGSMS